MNRFVATSQAPIASKICVLFSPVVLSRTRNRERPGMSHEIHAMSKATFYFVISVLVLTEIVQSRYKKKLLNQKQSAKV